MVAFSRGVAAGADGFECDVRLSSDGVPVVIHDPTLDRTTDHVGLVSTFPADVLGRIDATCRFQAAAPAYAVTEKVGVPTLESVLRRFHTTRIIVELKDTADALAHAVAGLIHRLGAESRVCVGSFHAGVLATFRTAAPDVATSASMTEAKWTLARSWLALPRVSPAPYRAFQVPERAGRLRVVRPAFVRQVHREGAVVQVWVVDAPADVHRLLTMGVDGVISDRPDLAVPVRDAWVAGLNRSTSPACTDDGRGEGDSPRP